MLLATRCALLLTAALAGRVNQHAFEEGKVPCGCNNKVGILAPKEKLQGIGIAPDPQCAKPGVHASETPGRFCSCDEGYAKNWKVAVSAAQKRLDDALQPKMEALKSLMDQLEEKLGVQIDSSSIGKLKPKVKSFPREEGEGLWVCCCQSQDAGKCKKNAEMENGWIKRGVHHKAPDRACEDEMASAPSEATEVTPTAEPEPEEPAEDEEVKEPEDEPIEEPTPEEPTPEEPTPTPQEPTVETENEDPESDSESETEDDTDDAGPEASEVAEPAPAPAPAAPAPAPRAALLKQIQGGFKLKKTKSKASSSKKMKPDLMSEIKAGVKLQPVREKKSSEASEKKPDLLSEIKAGVKLKPVKERKPEVTVTREPSLLDSIKSSPKFQALTEHMNSQPDEDEEEEWED